jgi:hypothetical protein
MHIRSRFMATARLGSETVRFDVRHVGLRPVLRVLTDGAEQLDVETKLGEPIEPSRWHAWCEDNIDKILPAIPRRQRRRIEATAPSR